MPATAPAKRTPPLPATDPGVASTTPPALAPVLGLRAFASARPLTWPQLLAAPVRWPRPTRLERALESPGGKRTVEGLRSLGVQSVGGLLEHLPRERREVRTIAALAPGEQAMLAVEVRSIASRPVLRRGMRPLVEATVCDATGAIGAAFFNQPWLVERYPPGTRLLLHGTARAGGRFAVTRHALDAPSGGGGASGSEVRPSPPAGQTRAVGHYPAAEGVSSVQIATLVREHRAALADVGEPLPAEVRVAERMPERAGALGAMHFPRCEEEAEEGRRRLAFEELLLMQLAVLRRRALRGSGSAVALGGPVAGEDMEVSDPPGGVLRGGVPPEGGPSGGDRPGRFSSGGVPSRLTARWLEELPFAPTDDQRAALAAIDADLGRGRPMQRLLMGEVGSGKTVVAIYALLRAVECGMQGALMAPTETLAEQHFATLQALVPGVQVPQWEVSAELLTGSTPPGRRAKLLARLAAGDVQLVVGTHALIEGDVRFERLAVAVVDEQHRFGVRQRAALDRKGAGALAPHVLHMTATPIPRTLALTEYGDLDVTCLRELPRGRRGIATHIAASAAERERAYERIREELRAGRQAYVVCPLVEESEALQARAAIAECERLREGELGGFRVELLHGQMRPREKQRVMGAFAAGAADVLVATTVIEVGIDVPNATVMLVEDAERYGISQLHQLRGRIGRGEHPSVCLLMGPRHLSRLQALAEHSDGFRLAEIDLALRGEGEIAGIGSRVRQHGQAEPRVASLPQDEPLLERAREWAQRLFAADPALARPEHVLLGEALERALGAEAHEPIPA
jgi:ATP-dependent DNA helicase RecG